MLTQLDHDATLSYFGLTDRRGQALHPSRPLSRALTDLLQALEKPARLGPALDAALDILVHGALRADVRGGRVLSDNFLMEELQADWPVSVSTLAFYAQLATDDFTDFLVNAIPRPVYDVLIMVLAQGFKRYFEQDPDLHPSDALDLFCSYNRQFSLLIKLEGPCSGLIAALARHLRAATPLDDPTPLEFTRSHLERVENYWEMFDFSNWPPSSETLAECEPFLKTQGESLEDAVRARIVALSVSANGPEGSADAERLDPIAVLERLKDRERRLLEDPLRHHDELLRVRSRCAYLEYFVQNEALEEGVAA